MIKLYAPATYWRLSPERKKEICNARGHKSKFDFVPDTIWFLDISEAYDIHDYCYHLATSLIGKEKADRIFLNNMNRLNEKTKWKWLKWLRKRKALKYYLAVRYFGGLAFWKDKNKSECMREIST